MPQSVHLCDYPEPNAALLDPDLNRRMTVAQLAVKLGHKLREESTLRVRQPLGELRFTCASAEQTAAVESLKSVIEQELNVKQLTACDNLDEYVSYTYKPNLKTLGPRYGKLLGAIRKELPELDSDVLAPLRNGKAVTVTIGGTEITLEPGDVLVGTEQAADWVCADEAGLQIALSTTLSPELHREGIRNDFIRHVQQSRKEADLEIQDRIRVFYQTDDETVRAAITEWSEYIATETLADSIEIADNPPSDCQPVSVGDAKARVWIEKV